MNFIDIHLSISLIFCSLKSLPSLVFLLCPCGSLRSHQMIDYNTFRNLLMKHNFQKMPKFKLIHPQCIYSHIEYLMSLIDLRREIQIRLNLLNLLQLFIFGMMWANLSYKTCTPYVSIVLGILSMVTLAWIGICQQRHIQKLGETITHLCIDSPFNNEDQSDRV